MLHLIILNGTQTFDSTPLDEETAHRRGLSLPESTQHSQDRDSNAPGEIRIHHLSKLTAVEQRLRLRGRRDRQTQIPGFKNLNFLYFLSRS